MRNLASAPASLLSVLPDQGRISHIGVGLRDQTGFTMGEAETFSDFSKRPEFENGGGYEYF
jgi:hypothetical protein